MTTHHIHLYSLGYITPGSLGDYQMRRIIKKKEIQNESEK